MYTSFNAYEKYKQQGVLTANPAELVVMLYDGCIKQLNIARLAIDEKKYDLSNRSMQKAQQIVMELVNSLDFHYPIAKDLMNIYDYVLRQIIAINTEKDGKRIKEVSGLLLSLRDAWVQVAKANKSMMAMAEQ